MNGLVSDRDTAHVFVHSVMTTFRINWNFSRVSRRRPRGGRRANVKRGENGMADRESGARGWREEREIESERMRQIRGGWKAAKLGQFRLVGAKLQFRLDLSSLPLTSLRNYSNMPQEKGGEKGKCWKTVNPRDHARGRSDMHFEWIRILAFFFQGEMDASGSTPEIEDRVGITEWHFIIISLIISWHFFIKRALIKAHTRGRTHLFQLIMHFGGGYVRIFFQPRMSNISSGYSWHN